MADIIIYFLLKNHGQIDQQIQKHIAIHVTFIQVILLLTTSFYFVLYTSLRRPDVSYS